MHSRARVRTHTHTHIYIYTYMYMYVYMHVYLLFIKQEDKQPREEWSDIDLPQLEIMDEDELIEQQLA